MSPLAALNLGLLLAIALLLFLPLLGQPVPAVWVIALLALRLGVRVWQGYQDPALRRPAAWLMDAALLGLLVFLQLKPAP